VTFTKSSLLRQSSNQLGPQVGEGDVAGYVLDVRLAVLVSGSGTLLEAMLDAELLIELVVADRTCRGLTIAAEAGVANALVERTDWTEGFDRNGYASQLIATLAEHDIDVVAMAGFGTILGEAAFEAMPDRIINTHPALLPSFPGWHAVRDAMDFGVKVSGCTIHVATAEVDHGPILAQEAVEVREDDDESSLHERIKAVERRLYVDTLRSIEMSGQLLGNPL